MCALEIKIQDIIENPDNFRIEGLAEDYPELVEARCFGVCSADLSVMPVDRNFWIEGMVSCGFYYECGTCGGRLPGKAKVPFKLLLDMSGREGLEWLEDEAGGFDDYIAKVGKNVKIIPIISIIREQILINCNPAFPEQNAEVKSCSVCAEQGFKINSSEDKPEIDPRWEKLAVLAKKKNRPN